MRRKRYFVTFRNDQSCREGIKKKKGKSSVRNPGPPLGIGKNRKRAVTTGTDQDKWRGLHFRKKNIQ